MKPTQTRELFANIKVSIVSFFSILMFVALGVGVFLGISWAGPALKSAADNMFDEGSLHHFQVQYVYGFTDDDLKKLSEVEGVSEVEGAFQSFQTLTVAGNAKTVKVQTMGEDIDVLTVVEGELPTRANEIALHSYSALELGLSVGDTIEFAKDVSKAETMGSLFDELNSATETMDSMEAAATEGGAATADSAAIAASAASAEPEEDPDGMAYLTGSTFTVTALVESPEYAAYDPKTYGYSTSSSGMTDMLAWVSPAAFDPKAFLDSYPVVNIRSASLQGLGTFSDEYKAESGHIEAVVKEQVGTLTSARYSELMGTAQKTIDDGEAKLEDAKQKIAEGEAAIEENRALLAEKRAEGEAKLAAAYDELIYWQSVYDYSLALYNKGKAAYDEANAILNEARSGVQSMIDRKAELDKQLAEGKITKEEYDRQFNGLVSEANAALAKYDKITGKTYQITPENFDAVMGTAKSALDKADDYPITFNGETVTLGTAEQKLAEAKATLDSSYAKIQSGWSEYYAGIDTLNEAVASGEQQIADAEAKVAEYRKLVAENEGKLAEAKEMFAQVQSFEAMTFPRTYNYGVAEISMLSGVTSNLSISMAALFIIVGLLVSYFAVSRIVHEQVTQIGTKKALGARRREITESYLWYSGIAVVIGAVVGTIVGYTVVEGIIGGVLGSMFAFGAYPPYFGWVLFLFMTVAELVLILGATYVACRSVLKRNAIDLLLGEQSVSGKEHFYEKWKSWAKLPLFMQIIVNNCVTDRRRLLSTIVGVAGCTALIVTAITLNNDVMKSYDRHYEEVYGFNAIIYADQGIEGTADNLRKAVEQQGATAASVSMRSYLMELPDGESNAVRIIVPADEATFADVYHTRPVSAGEFDLSGDGAWVTRAYAEHYGAKVGDTVLVNMGDGTSHEIPILGFYGFFLPYHEMVMGQDYYEKEFGAPPSFNAVIADTGDMAVKDLGEQISSIEGFDSIVDDKTYQYGNFKTFSSVSQSVVAIYLALAVLMAIVVLLNLNVMFIQEKKRELIVLMINGFNVKDARHYVSYDTIVLTAFGIIVGLILGCLMGTVTVGAVEPGTASFVKDIDPMAVIVGIVGSALLSFVMSRIALHRVSKFELADINRL